MKKSATLIDNIFVSNPEDVLISGNIVSDITDHFSQVCLLSSSKEFHGVKSKKARDFSSFSVNQFKTAISTINWIDITGNFGTNVNRAFSTFCKKLNKIVNKFAPIRELSNQKLKQLSKPWITKGIRHSIKIKNKLFASGDQARYKIYRNKLSNLIRLSKKYYYAKYFNDNVTNMKKTWEGINNLLYRSKKSSRNISTLKDPKKGQLTKDPVRIPSIFNEHFASVGRNLASNLPSSQGSYMDYLAKSTSPASSFFFQPVTEAEVRLEILSIPNGKSHGLYSCPTHMLKHAHQYLSEPLALLI